MEGSDRSVKQRYYFERVWKRALYPCTYQIPGEPGRRSGSGWNLWREDVEGSDRSVKQRYYFERVWKRALFCYAKFRKEVQIMNEVQIFNNEEFGQVRTLVIDGEYQESRDGVLEADGICGEKTGRDLIAL